MIFCGSGATSAIDKLIGILNLRIPADLDDRYGLTGHIPAGRTPGGVHRAVRAPLQRAAVARVDRRRGRDPRGRRRPHRPRLSSSRARRPRGAAAQDRLVLGRHATSPASSRTPARSPTCCTGTARCRSGTSRRPRRTSTSRWSPTCCNHAEAHKDAIFLSPAQVHRRTRDAGRADRAALAAHQPRPGGARRRHRRLRQPDRARAT